MTRTISVTAYWMFALMTATALMLSSQIAAAQSTANITAIVLNVTHRSGATGQFVKSKVGTQLPVGSQVRTGRRSKCEVKFPGGTVVRMAERSDMIITSVTEHRVKLLSGQVLASVVRGQGAQVEGATATASVRGTLVLFSAKSAPGEYPPQGEEVSIWDGEAEISTDKDSAILGHGQKSGIDPTGDISPAGAALPTGFPTGGMTPWWQGLRTGGNVQATPGTPAGAEFKRGTASSGQADAIAGTLGRPGAGLDIIIESVPGTTPATSGSPAGVMLLAALPSAYSGRDQPGSVLGRKFYGPRSDVDLFGVRHSGGYWVGGRARVSAIWGEHLYLEAGVQSISELEGAWETELSEGFGLWRQGSTELTIGRQHYTAGPVNNSTLGSLFSYPTFDGIMLHHGRGDLDVHLAWIDSFDDDTLDTTHSRGGLARVSASLPGGSVGVNCLRENDVGTGVSGDVSYAVIPGRLDLYAEFGRDTRDRRLFTAGVYFPGIYQANGLDVFIEYAERSGLGMWTGLAYQELNQGWTGLAGVRKTEGGDWEAAAGAFKRFGSLN